MLLRHGWSWTTVQLRLELAALAPLWSALSLPPAPACRAVQGCLAPCSMQLQPLVITLQQPDQASTPMQVLGGQVLAVQASQTAIHTSTLPCSGSSSPTRSPSSSHQGPVAASAAPPDAAASLKSTGSPNKPAMQPHRADCPDKPVIEPQKPSSPAASEHHAAGEQTDQAIVPQQVAQNPAWRAHGHPTPCMRAQVAS